MIITLSKALSFHQMGKRENQEDARYPDADVSVSRMFVVCDGVGGRKHGEVASNTVCMAMAEELGHFEDSIIINHEVFAKALSRVYDRLDDAGKQGCRGMSTTMTMALFHGGGLMIAHIGDSRVYQIRQGRGIIRRTRDHSLVEEMVSCGTLTEDEASNHPMSNVITRSMTSHGDERCAATVTSTQDVERGDMILLCTDGVTHQITDAELERLMTSDLSDDEKMRKLAEVAAGSTDNNTALIVRVGSVKFDSDFDADMCDITVDVKPAGKENVWMWGLKRVIDIFSA